MGSIRQRKGRYQVQVRRKGYPTRTKSFLTLKDAQRWERSQELQIDTLPSGQPPLCGNHVSDLLRQFERSVLPSLKGHKQEASRLRRINSEFGSVPAQELRNHHLAAYRDQRLKEVGPQTVKHEINLLRRVLKLASAEWGITLPYGVPSIRMPRLPRGRERRVPEKELLAIMCQLTPVMAAIVTIAVETAMRRSEIIRLESEDLLAGRHLRIKESKNGRSRVIPLNSVTHGAVHLLLRGPVPSADSVSQAFRRVCNRLNVVDLHFHDLRHEAISRLFEKGLSVPEVAAISGHDDFRMLARYAHVRTAATQPMERINLIQKFTAASLADCSEPTS